MHLTTDYSWMRVFELKTDSDDEEFRRLCRVHGIDKNTIENFSGFCLAKLI